MRFLLLACFIVLLGINNVGAEETQPVNCTTTSSGEKICDIGTVSTVLMNNPIVTELMKQTVNYVGVKMMNKMIQQQGGYPYPYGTAYPYNATTTYPNTTTYPYNTTYPSTTTTAYPYNTTYPSTTTTAYPYNTTYPSATTTAYPYNTTYPTTTTPVTTTTNNGAPEQMIPL